MAAIAVLGDYDAANATHRATDAALVHSAARLGVSVSVTWLPTDAYRDGQLADYAGLFVSPGSPYRDFGNVLQAIRWAREQRLPTLGTCGGFQHMVIEYARHVLGIADAAHAESDPDASVLFVAALECSLAGRELEIALLAGTQTEDLYGSTKAAERYYCSFGVNPNYVPQLRDGPLVIAGSDAEGEVRVIELPGHPFFIGTLFVPQAQSTAARPHPLVTGFMRAAVMRS